MALVDRGEREVGKRQCRESSRSCSPPHADASAHRVAAAPSGSSGCRRCFTTTAPPHARALLKLENRTRLAALKLRAAAREQLTIALEMIDEIDLQLARFDLSLREYARKQTGCRTLTDQI